MGVEELDGERQGEGGKWVDLFVYDLAITLNISGRGKRVEETPNKGKVIEMV